MVMGSHCLLVFTWVMGVNRILCYTVQEEYPCKSSAHLFTCVDIVVACIVKGFYTRILKATVVT